MNTTEISVGSICSIQKCHHKDCFGCIETVQIQSKDDKKYRIRGRCDTCRRICERKDSWGIIINQPQKTEFLGIPLVTTT